MVDSLHTEPERDQFRSESPIRAFTDWQERGGYALGKGFRPSLQHVVPYLDAMERKEGWRLVQVLEAGTQTPSFVFHKLPSITLGGGLMFAPSEKGEGEDEPYVRNAESGAEAMRKIDMMRQQTEPPVHSVLQGDPVNPAHYAGRACADIGERLSANGYQVLKYCWRLGKKDDPCVELGKALWYLDSEAALLRHFPLGHTVSPVLRGLKPEHRTSFLEDRLVGLSDMTQVVARLLWAGYNRVGLVRIREVIQTEKTYLDCGRSLAV